MESLLSVGGARISDYLDSGKLRQTIADLLVKTPGHEWWHASSRTFVAPFDSPHLAKWSTFQSEITDLLARGDNLAQALSEEHLALLVDTMLSPSGLTVDLARKGAFREYHAVVTLKAKLSDLVDLPDQTIKDAESGSTAKSKGGVVAGTGSKASGGFGGQTRVQAKAGPASATYINELKYTQERTRSSALESGSKSSVVRKDGDGLTDDGGLGKRTFHKFRTDLEITHEVRSYNRLNERTRGLTPSLTPGRTVPEVLEVGAVTRPAPGTTGATPAKHVVELELLVPDSLVSTTKPAPLAVEVRNRTQTENPVYVNRLSAGPRALDNVELVTVLGGEHVVGAIKDSLLRATDNDPAITFPDAVNTAAYDAKLSPDALRRNPTLFSEVVKVEGIHWGRRVADLDARAGVVFTPTNARPLGAAEFRTIQDRIGDRAGFASGKGTAHSVGMTNTGFFGVASPKGDVVKALGMFLADIAPGGFRWGRNAAGQITSVERTAYEHGVPVRQRLVLADLGVQVGVEALYKGNLNKLKRPNAENITREGESLDLTGSALMWATDEQIAVMNGEAAPAPRPLSTVDGKTLPPPASLVRSGKPSLGIGRVADTIDLRSMVDDVRQSLKAWEAAHNKDQGLADRLLPESSLGANHDNVGALTDYLANAHRSVNNSFQGGNPLPLRLEDRLTGKTYYASLNADFHTAPAFAGIDHAGQVVSADKATSKSTTDRSHGATALAAGAAARPGLRVAEATTAQDATKTTGQGNTQGTVAAGIDGTVELGKYDHKTTTETQVDHKQSATAAGPMAAYAATLAFDLTIQRDFTVDANGRESAGTVVAEVSSGPVDATVVKLPEESLPAPTRSTYGEADAAVKVGKEGRTPAALAAWRDKGAADLPPEGTFHVEHFLGKLADLRAAAQKAIELSGVEVDSATVAALRDGLTVAALKAGLPAMRRGEFVLPLPPHLGRDLEVHVRFPEPGRLASASAGVEVKDSTKSATKVKDEVKFGNEYKSGGTATANAGSAHPAGNDKVGQRDNFNSVIGGSRKRLPFAAKADVGTIETSERAGSVTTPQSPDAVKPAESITRADLRSAEFRLVSRGKDRHLWQHSGATYLPIHDAFVIRGNDSTLPQPLVDAVKDLKAKGEEWNKAVIKLEGLQHTLDADALGTERLEATAQRDLAAAEWWKSHAAYETALADARLGTPPATPTPATPTPATPIPATPTPATPTPATPTPATPTPATPTPATPTPATPTPATPTSATPTPATPTPVTPTSATPTPATPTPATPTSATPTPATPTPATPTSATPTPATPTPATPTSATPTPATPTSATPTPATPTPATPTSATPTPATPTPATPTPATPTPATPTPATPTPATPTPATPTPATPTPATPTPATPTPATPTPATPTPATPTPATPTPATPTPATPTPATPTPATPTPATPTPATPNPTPSMTEQTPRPPAEPSNSTQSTPNLAKAAEGGVTPQRNTLAPVAQTPEGKAAQGKQSTSESVKVVEDGATPQRTRPAPVAQTPEGGATQGKQSTPESVKVAEGGVTPQQNPTTPLGQAPEGVAEQGKQPIPEGDAAKRPLESVTLGDEDGAPSRSDADPAGAPRRLSELAAFDRSWVEARIEYLRRAEEFESRLAEHVMGREDVKAEFGRFVAEVWKRLPPRSKAFVGVNEHELAGGVGKGHNQNYAVVTEGNLRERITLLWAIAREDFLDRSLSMEELHRRHPETLAERPQRRATEVGEAVGKIKADQDLTWAASNQLIAEASRGHRTLNPDDVNPPLSARERAFSVHDGDLRWLPAELMMDMRLYLPPTTPEGSLHQRSEHSGGLVTTGTSGSTFLVLTLARMLNEAHGTKLDLPLLRAGLFGFMHTTHQHTYHEVMRAAALVDPALVYDDNFGRYHRFGPITEQALRDQVAVDGRFPDEHALDKVDWDAARAAAPHVEQPSRHSDPFDLEDVVRDLDRAATENDATARRVRFDESVEVREIPGNEPRPRHVHAVPPPMRMRRSQEPVMPEHVEFVPDGREVGTRTPSPAPSSPVSESGFTFPARIDPAEHFALYEEAMGLRPRPPPCPPGSPSPSRPGSTTSARPPPTTG
ncbi:hypothetical protein ACOBQX_03815 [Actinokineospora sp. G85]|uniref:hypothetical protein n=1 Tax=Actinokineospora sp. G85 TaxID=3406626 RepID=UPI003C795C93